MLEEDIVGIRGRKGTVSVMSDQEMRCIVVETGKYKESLEA